MNQVTNSPVKSWLGAARLRTLPLAASSIITGSALGWHDSNNPWSIFILALLTCIVLQILSNFANDYGDYEKGTDNASRVGPTRALQSGNINKKQMKNAIVITSLLALIVGIALLLASFQNSGKILIALMFFLLGIVSIGAAYKYTAGKNPYGYRGLGDLAVFLFFGIIGVAGTFYLHTLKWNPSILLPASAIGLFSTAVLNLNNMRDHVNDKASGKITTVVRLGFDKAKWYHFALLFCAWFCLVLFLVSGEFSSWKWLVLMPLPFTIVHFSKVMKTTNPANLDPELKKIALTAFVCSLLLLVTLG